MWSPVLERCADCRHVCSCATECTCSSFYVMGDRSDLLCNPCSDKRDESNEERVA